MERRQKKYRLLLAAALFISLLHDEIIIVKWAALIGMGAGCLSVPKFGFSGAAVIALMVFIGANGALGAVYDMHKKPRA